MDEFVCVTLRSKPTEPENEFSDRLSTFWTHILRNFEEEFEKIYAETTSFERDGEYLTRQYLVEEDVLGFLEHQLTDMRVDYVPIDPDERFTKYEAVAPDWMQIEH